MKSKSMRRLRTLFGGGLLLIAVSAGLPAPDAATPLSIYRAVSLTSQPYGPAKSSADWILLEPSRAPTSYTAFQDYRNHGSTTSGQPRLVTGPSRARTVDLTLVGTGPAVVLQLDNEVKLGVSEDFSGDEFTWWRAHEIPKEAKSANARFVLEGKHPDARLSLGTQTAADGSPDAIAFAAACNGVGAPDLQELTGKAVSTGVLYCFGKVLVARTWHPTDATHQETTSMLVSGGQRVELSGLPSALLQKDNGLWLVSIDGHTATAVAIAPN